MHSAITDSLPLTEATFFIMLSLSPHPQHGYAIMKDVESLSEQRIILSTGTLYGALKRMLEQGWIERIDDGHQSDQDQIRPRKSYALTELGRGVLNAEIQRLRSLVALARLQASESGT